MVILKKAAESAILLFLVLSSLAATVVAPTKSELETMYSAAAQEVDAGHYRDALRKLDSIDARQPDFAAAQNLRGVAWMRLEEFGKAETALRKARELDPAFWEARFNLAEVPFLEENWTESRRRFTELYESPNDQLEPVTVELIEFKILLTYILEDKEKLAAKLLEKFEAATTSPGGLLAKAALAFRNKKTAEAKDLVAQAGQLFGPEMNQLFLESFYEVGWLKKEAGAGPIALEVESTAERVARAQANLGKAERAFHRGDFATALTWLDEVDATAPNQAVALNLRGQILLDQGQLEEAERVFRKALEADPQSNQVRYNLARIPLAKKDYDTARKELEALLGATGGGKGQAQREQLIRYQIFLTLLLEGRDGPAQKTMDGFNMMDGTPALYYAQAAWAFQHGNPQQAGNWIANARNIFPSELNRTFAAPLVNQGWIEGAAAAPLTVSNLQTKPTPAPTEPASAVAEATPAAEEAPPAAHEESTPAESGLAMPEPAYETEASSEEEPSKASPPAPKKRSARTKSSDEDSDNAAKRSKRSASEPRASSPTPTPASSPARPQNLGDKVARFFLYPFRRKEEAKPTATPAAQPPSGRPPASPSPGRRSKN